MNAPVPNRPLLAPWYRLVGDGERLVLEHARSVVVLEGAAVRTFLPALLPLLDGTRTVDELVSRLGPAVRPALDAALTTLVAHDLVIDGSDRPRARERATEAAASAFGLPLEEAADRLGAARVGVVGSGVVAEPIARILHAAGVDTVERIGWGSGASADVVVVVPGADEVERVHEWNRVAHAEGIRWVYVRPFDGAISTVGPLIVPGETCCHACHLLRAASNLEYGTDMADIESAPVAAIPDASAEAFAAALAAHIALRWAVGRDSRIPGLLHVLAMRPRLSMTTHHVLRVPRCPVCSGRDKAASPLPWHEAVAG